MPTYNQQKGIERQKEIIIPSNISEVVTDFSDTIKRQVEKVLARNDMLTQELIIKNSKLSDLERTKGLKNDFPELSDTQIQGVINIHHTKEGKLFQHNSKQMWDKIGAMGEIGIDRKTAIKIMDYGYAGKINNIGTTELGFNNLEISLLDSLGLELNNLLHIDSIPKLEEGINKITNRQEAEILLQLLNKLPKNFTGEFLKGYQAKIAYKLENLKIDISELQGIIESDFRNRFKEVINQDKNYILALDSITLNKQFFNQVLGINIADCDKILDAIQVEKSKGSNILLSALMKRFEKVKDMLRSEDHIEIEIDNLEIVRNRFTADIQDRINDVSIKIGKSLTVEQKQLIQKIHENIEHLYDDLLEQDIEISELNIEEIKALLNKTTGREDSLRNVGFSDADISLLINNGII